MLSRKGYRCGADWEWVPALRMRGEVEGFKQKISLNSPEKLHMKYPLEKKSVREEVAG